MSYLVLSHARPKMEPSEAFLSMTLESETQDVATFERCASEKQYRQDADDSNANASKKIETNSDKGVAETESSEVVLYRGN